MENHAMSSDGVPQVALGFFSFLSILKMNYSVLGDYSKIPFDIDGDIDIVLSHPDFLRAPGVVREFCEQNNLILTQIIQHEVTAIYACIVWFSADGKFNSLRLDICSDYMANGYTYIQHSDLLNKPEYHFVSKSAGFYRCSSAINTQYYFVKKAIKRDKSFFSSAQCFKLLQELTLFESLECSRAIFGLEIDIRVSEDYTKLRHIENIKSGELFRKRQGFKNIYGEIKRVLNRVIHPSGLVVAFLGPDGSGKSTLISDLMANSECYARRSDYYHFRPRVINGSAQSSPVISPHGKLNRGKFASVLKIVYFFVDYWLGFVLKIFLQKRRSSLVVFDRYFNDMFVDTRRYRMSIPLGVLRFSFKWFPKPDLWVVLQADPSKIINRKPEVSLEECQRQVIEYKRLAAELPDCLIVDTSFDSVTSAAEVNLFIAKHLASRLNSL